MASLWVSYYMTWIYRPDTKWELDLVFQVLPTQMISNFFRFLDQQKNFTNDIIMIIAWHSCNFKTRLKMRTRFDMHSSTSSTSIVDFELCHFFRCVRLTKELHQWRDHDCHISWLKFTERHKMRTELIYQASEVLQIRFVGHHVYTILFDIVKVTL